MLASPSNLRLLYPLSLALIVSPALELAVRMWPLQLHLAQWRFQTELAIINSITLVLLGLLIAGLVAWATEETGILKAVAAIAMLVGMALLPTIALFFLDGQDVQQMAQSSVRGSLRNNTYVAILKGLLSSLAALSLGLGLWRAARDLDVSPSRGESRRRAENSDDVLLVSADR